MNVPLINVHTHRRTGVGIEVVSVMATPQSTPLPSAPFSLGIHPWQVAEAAAKGDATLADFTPLLPLVEQVEADAVGEIGLDFARQGSRELQMQVFTAQLRIAEKLAKPVVIHCVKAFEPLMTALAEYELPAVLLHGFIGSPEQAARARDAGYFLSFGERSLGSLKTVESLKQTSPSGLFLETDESPLSIAELYERASELLALSVPQLAEYLHASYQKVFTLDHALA